MAKLLKNIPKEDVDALLNGLKKENKSIYSFSKLTSGDSCPYEAYLKYVKKLKGDTIYTLLGTLLHTLCEDYVLGKCTDNQEMLNKFNKEFTRLTIIHRFPTEKAKDNYHTDIENFLKNFKGLPKEFEGWNIMTEAFVLLKFNESTYVQGYVDLFLSNPETKEFVIVDHKTSSKYTGKKRDEHAFQLLIYLESIKQMTEYKKGRVMWNFIKYANVSYRLKNGKMKTAVWERKEMLEKMWNEMVKRFNTEIDTMMRLKMKREFYLEQKVYEDKLTHVLDFSLEDAYVEYPVSDTVSEDVRIYIEKKITEFENRMKGGEEAFIPIKIHDRKDEDGLPFYCSKLCMHKNSCPHYKKLKEKVENSLQ